MRMRKCKRLFAAMLTAAVCAGVLGGCSMPEPSRFDMTDDTAKPIESDLDITGTWVVPSQDTSLTFNADGTYTTSDDEKGTYTFMSGNENFAIADLFDEVHYISLTGEDGKILFSGAVLGDVISGYNEAKNVDRYFVRQGRDPVTEEQLIGDWNDVNSEKYTLNLKKDGVAETADGEGTYTIQENEEHGTEITVNVNDIEDTYAVIRYEKYLFMYRIGGYVMYQMQPTE